MPIIPVRIPFYTQAQQNTLQAVIFKQREDCKVLDLSWTLMESCTYRLSIRVGMQMEWDILVCSMRTKITMTL